MCPVPAIICLFCFFVVLLICVCGLFYGVYAYNLTIPYPTFWVMVAYDKNGACTVCTLYLVPSTMMLWREVIWTIAAVLLLCTGEADYHHKGRTPPIIVQPV